MQNLNRAFATLLITVAAAAASAQGLSRTSADYGNAAANAQPDRVIVVTPGTRSINVTNGETVAFSVDGKRFNWQFDTFHDQDNFDLAKIAPQGSQVEGVRVYVAPNPLRVG